MLWRILIQVYPLGATRYSLLFMWIDTHSLANLALNISPFFAGAIHTSANAHNAFFFSFTEIVYQTHRSPLSGRGPFRAHPDPVSVMPK
jgi:hypothetical protein